MNNNKFTSESLQDAQPHNSLSMYEVDSPMGRGAGGFVYKVKNRKTKQYAALKVIEKKCGDKIKQRIQNEIDVHSSLKHENVVSLHAHFEDNDNYYILMELCEGGELYNLVKKKGRFTEAEVRNYGLQFARGLKYLHENNVLHRDLKLSNLLLTDQNVLKICDFGLAVKLTDMKSERDTLCGTPNYISPEVIKQEPYGTKADTWAFGCILYAMATGSPPFEGASVKDTLAKVQSGAFTLPDNISPALQDLLKKLICWDSQTRMDIGNVLSHAFFAETPLPSLGRARSKPEKIIVGHNISFGDSDFISQSCDSDTQQSAEDNCDSSPLFADSYNSEYMNHHRVSSAAVSPLLKKPPLALKKASASLFRVSVTCPDQDNKENHGMGNCESLADSYGSTSSYKSQETKNVNRNSSKSSTEVDGCNTDNTLAKRLRGSLSLNNTIKSDCALRTIDQNLPSNNGPRVYALGMESTSSAGGEDEKKPHVNITPLNTNGLKPNKFKIKGGSLEVASNGWICIDIVNSKRKISISPDGQKMKIEKCNPFRVENTYSLSDIPAKYLKFYTYASQVCDTMRSRVPRVKIEDGDGKFCLVQNKPFPNFEGEFISGERVLHTLSSEIMKIQMNDGRVYEINVLEDASYLNEHLSSIIKKSLDKVNLCIQKGDVAH